MNLRLERRVALVTAASRGLGFAVARSLAMEGARVVICGRDRGRIEHASAAIHAVTGRAVRGVVADVGRQDDCDRLVAETVETQGRVDILVTNTGGPPVGIALASAQVDWDEAYRSILMSVLHLSRAVSADMRKRRWGRIVSVASISARQPVPGLAISNAFRPALLGLAKTLALELAPAGILVNTVLPGFTRTDRLDELAPVDARAEASKREAFLASLAEEVPLRRLGEPEELASLVCFLSSEHASYITGTVIPVDGGLIRGL